MTARLYALAVCAMLTLALVIGGCSGPGVTVAAIQAASLQDLASDHVSAVLLLRGWLKIMYVKTLPDAGPCTPDRHSQQYPDGSRHSWGTNSDCSEYDFWVYADGSGEGTMTSPGGGVEDVTWSAPTWDGDLRSVDIEKVLPDGTRLDITYSSDSTEPGTPNSTIGQAVLADGRRMDFALHRRTQAEDRLRLDLPDGSVLEAVVPNNIVNYALYWPIFDPGGWGYFTGATGERLDFGISGAGDRWDRWTFAAANGTTGQFVLDGDFAGHGNISRNGAVQGALVWPESGMGTLDLVDAGSAEVAPSAAARDFQVDRWVANMAAMGPAPMY